MGKGMVCTQKDDYKALVADIFNGKVAVSNDIAKEPAHSITLNVYPNIK